jgi:hypothetical protein
VTTSILRLALVSGLGLAALLVAPRSTLADYYDNNFDKEQGWVLTVETIPFAIQTFNTCDDFELVNVNGTAIIATKTLTDNGNFTYVKSKQELSASGTGLESGATYLLNDLQIFRVKTHSPLPFSFILHETTVLNGQGVVPTQTVDIYIRLLINAKGNTTSDIFQLAVRCS